MTTDASGASETSAVAVEYAVRHPTGHIDEKSTATTFGATKSLYEAQVWVEYADSDCLCSDGSGPHIIVKRTIYVSPWCPATTSPSGD